MPSLEYFLVAEGVSVDQDTNRLSVFNVLEEVHIIKDESAIVPQIYGVVALLIEPEDWGIDFQATLRASVTGEEEKREFHVNFQPVKDHVRHRIFFNIIAVKVATEGILEFEILINNKHLAKHLVSIVKDSSS